MMRQLPQNTICKNVRKLGLLSSKLDEVLCGLYYLPENVSVRDFAQRIGVSKSSVSVYLRKCKKLGLTKDSLYFKQKKIHFGIELLVKSGLIEYIITQLQPRCIILFGSFRKGEFDRKSDVDLFIESYNSSIDVSSFEKKLGHSVDLFIHDSISDVPSDLKENIINGIKLYGSVKLAC